MCYFSHVAILSVIPKRGLGADGLLALRGWQWLFILQGGRFSQLHA